MTEILKSGSQKNKDDLLRCDVCGEPLEAYYPESFMKTFHSERDRHHVDCKCMRREKEAMEREQKEKDHKLEVERLRRECFRTGMFSEATFVQSKIRNLHTEYCQRYAEHWEEEKEKNIGLLLWGDVGTGKTFTAACIANALLEQEVSVRMVNFSYIMNTGMDERNTLIDALSRCGLLIIDDFGKERETEYGLEIIHHVLDARYNSKKPLIITTNLPLYVLNNPPTDKHKAIYDRVKNCVRIQFTGESLRQEEGAEKMNAFKKILSAAGEKV